MKHAVDNARSEFFAHTNCSVAMATYNGARFLPEQFASIANQTVLPDEIVVRDDNSTDRSSETIAEQLEPIGTKCLVLPSGERLGCAANFMNVIGNCSGEYIFLADQDDVWRDDKVEAMIDAMDRFPEAAFGFSNARLVDESGRAMGKSLWDVLSYRPGNSPLQPQRKLFIRQLTGNVVTGATMVIRNRSLAMLPEIPEGWLHDAWIATCLSAWFPAVAIDQPLVDYRQHSTQSVGATRERFRVSRIFAGQQSDRITKTLDQLASNLRQLENALGVAECPAESLSEVRNAFRHFKARVAIRLSVLSNTGLLWRELRTGCYHRYSLGLSSFIRDALRF